MIPPTIPTSFVPHSASAGARIFRSDFTGAFGFFAYGVLGIVLVLALGVFSYGRLLAARQATKDAALASAQASVDPAALESFVRLRDRLSSGQSLLSNHVAFSGLFSVLSSIMPTTIRFTSLHPSIDSRGVVMLEGAGVAKNFNALAAASEAFAADGRVKDAIFSGISVNSRDSSVSFSLSATIDPKLVAFSPSASVSGTTPASPAASTTLSL